MHDINRYRMAPGFFASFPNFRDDIGTAETSPLSIMTLPLPSEAERAYIEEEL